jgi:hypothetical protein
MASKSLRVVVCFMFVSQRLTESRDNALCSAVNFLVPCWVVLQIHLFLTCMTYYTHTVE